jgi:hypothetical protein
MGDTRGERWFWRLVGLTAAVGTVWYYTWWLPGPARLFGPSVALLALVVLVVWVTLARDRRRGAVARAERLERDLWAGTLPGAAARVPAESADPPPKH